jgi:hypothetical protein
MPVRTAYAGAAVAGEVLTAANVNKIPGGWIGYAEVTANQGSITAQVDLTGLSVAVTVGSSRRLRITAQAHFASTVASDGVALFIQEGATTLNVLGLQLPTSAGVTQGITCAAVITPTAGAHTYKLQASRNTGTGTVNLAASATQPAFILVEDIGPAT